MPLTLPGLFDFTTGVNSAIAQQNSRAQASSAQSRSFIDQLNAFNTGLNTNDNLELRRGFAQQPEGTSILDRFSNLSASSTNPFVTSQAVVQGQALAPLLAQNAVQNPFFAQSQGLPTTATGALNNGFLGFNPILQQQSNESMAALLALNNPAPNVAQFQDLYQQSTLQALQNQQQQLQQQKFEQQQQQTTELQKQLADALKRLNGSTPNRQVNTAAPPAPNAAANVGLNSSFVTNGAQ